MVFVLRGRGRAEVAIPRVLQWYVHSHIMIQVLKEDFAVQSGHLSSRINFYYVDTI